MEQYLKFFDDIVNNPLIYNFNEVSNIFIQIYKSIKHGENAYFDLRNNIKYNWYIDENEYIYYNNLIIKNGKPVLIRQIEGGYFTDVYYITENIEKHISSNEKYFYENVYPIINTIDINIIENGIYSTIDKTSQYGWDWVLFIEWDLDVYKYIKSLKDIDLNNRFVNIRYDKIRKLSLITNENMFDYMDRLNINIFHYEWFTKELFIEYIYKFEIINLDVLYDKGWLNDENIIDTIIFNKNTNKNIFVIYCDITKQIIKTKDDILKILNNDFTIVWDGIDTNIFDKELFEIFLDNINSTNICKSKKLLYFFIENKKEFITFTSFKKILKHYKNLNLTLTYEIYNILSLKDMLKIEYSLYPSCFNIYLDKNLTFTQYISLIKK